MMDSAYTCIKLILKAYLVCFSRGVHFSLEEPFPTGAKIIAANHPNATDSFFLPFLFPEKLHFLVQANIFSIPVFGWLLGWAGQIPVHPIDRCKALERACEVLARNQTVVIFPEGRLNPKDVVLKAGTGAVRMSLASGAPIIPVGIHVPDCSTLNIHYTSRGILHQGRWQTGGHCFIRFGSPWLPSREISESDPVENWRSLTACLMEKIHGLTIQASLESMNYVNSLAPFSMLQR
jgi:1-acyl-sn-glycerol-3-phosphate acyltransferase